MKRFNLLILNFASEYSISIYKILKVKNKNAHMLFKKAFAFPIISAYYVK